MNMAKILSLTLLLIFTTTTLNAQKWHTDFSEAKTIASKENKPIVLVFQGSDWCAPCIKLDREIWSTSIFQNYADKHYIMLKADFPRKKKNALSPEQTAANAKLADSYNKNGIFPFVVVLDSNGIVLGETSYKRTTPELYIKELNTFTN